MRQLVLHNTNVCNFKCEHCFRAFDRKNHFPLLSLLKVLPEAKKLGFDSIAFTGGEPCIHPEFKSHVDAVLDHGMDFSVVTNGWFLDRYQFTKKHPHRVNFMAHSLDGATAEIHDRQRLQKGSFDKVLKSVKWFLDNGVYAKFVMCLTQLNKHQINDMHELCIKYNIPEVVYCTVIKTSHKNPKTNDTNNNMALSDKEKLECIGTINNLRKKGYNIRVQIASSLQGIVGPFGSPIVNFCRALDVNTTNDLVINPKGEVSMCCDLVRDGAPVGSLNEYSFTELYYKVEEMQKKLKEKRRKMINSKEYKNFAGFNTCEFCNICLEDQII